MDHVTLPEPYSARMLTFHDLEPYREFRQQVVPLARTSLNPSTIQAEWNFPGFDFERSNNAVFDKVGSIVAYAELYDYQHLPVRPVIKLLHLEACPDAALTYLVDWCQHTASRVFERVPTEAKVTVQTWVSQDDQRLLNVLYAQGWRQYRSSYTMGVRLEQPPPLPDFPDDLTLVSLDMHGEFDTFVQVFYETFKSHRDYVYEPFQNFLDHKRYEIAHEAHFDRSLWWLAQIAGENAGVVLCSQKSEETPPKGEINIVGVLPAFRRRGLGLLLVKYGLARLYEKGSQHITLHVDSASLTNAHKVYERAGMSIEGEAYVYNLMLRPGTELTLQS